MAYTKPTKSENIISDIKGYQPDPHIFDYKKELKMGESVDFRIMRMDAEGVLYSEGKKATIINPKEGTPMNITVFYPGKEVASKIFDSEGVCLEDAPSTPIVRLLVWVYHKNVDVDRNGQTTRQIPFNRLMYFEFTKGLAVSLNNLETFQRGIGRFNKKTGRPDYDVSLTVTPGINAAIKKTYTLAPILSEFDPDTGEAKHHKNWNKEAEVALADHMDVVEKTWDEVNKAMRKVPSPEEVKRQFERGRGSSPSNTMPGRGGSREEAYTEPVAGFDPNSAYDFSNE
jgi:hypothetical protein